MTKTLIIIGVSFHPVVNPYHPVSKAAGDLQSSKAESGVSGCGIVRLGLGGTVVAELPRYTRSIVGRALPKPVQAQNLLVLPPNLI
jgi:hypothetical protein